MKRIALEWLGYIAAQSARGKTKSEPPPLWDYNGFGFLFMYDDKRYKNLVR